jgi:hypothetical protein
MEELNKLISEYLSMYVVKNEVRSDLILEYQLNIGFGSPEYIDYGKRNISDILVKLNEMIRYKIYNPGKVIYRVESHRIFKSFGT